jgi:YHS domain-containing protein
MESTMPSIHGYSASNVLLRCAALLLFGLQGCSSMNTISDGADHKLMLKGHDPVAYFTDAKHVLGDPAIKAEHDGVTYRFANASHRDAFLKSPAKYVPQYGGYCSNGAVYGIPWGGDPDSFKIVDGRLFIFGGHKSKDYWSMDEKRNIELGDHYWETEMKDRGALMQRYYRLIFRVPHYKTGKQLEAEWQARGQKTEN